MSERILILGSGGREHALVRHLVLHGHQVFAWPGSDAISLEAQCLHASGLESLIECCRKESIKNVIVGPEQYLFESYADELSKAGLYVFGPRKEVAQLETDKAFAKNFFLENHISTARAITVSNSLEAKSALKEFFAPYVVKASGLAQGKGVWIGASSAEALKVSEEFLETHDSLVIEEFLEGTELSCFYLVDGMNYEFFGTAQDHKRLLNNDLGPNTGGMGAVSPSRFENSELISQIEHEIIKPTLQGLANRSLSYRGFLFLGLMRSKEKIYVLEYNCRMGDPETQSVMQRLESDLWKSILDLREGRSSAVRFSPQSAVSVVVAAQGYPTKPTQGIWLGESLAPKELQILHSSTRLTQEKSWTSQGGRIFTVNASGPIRASREKIYAWILEWQKSLGPQQNQIIYRTDIGENYE